AFHVLIPSYPDLCHVALGELSETCPGGFLQCPCQHQRLILNQGVNSTHQWYRYQTVKRIDTSPALPRVAARSGPRRRYRLFLQEVPARQRRHLEVIVLRQRLIKRRREERRDARGHERRRHHRDHHPRAVGHLHDDDEGGDRRLGDRGEVACHAERDDRRHRGPGERRVHPLREPRPDRE